MKKSQFLLLILTSIILISGCSKQSKKTNSEIVKKESIDEVVKIDFGKTAKLGNGSEITFSNLISDSRCPIGAKCVWEGTAEIGLELIQGEQRHKFSLELISKRKDSKLDTLGYSFEFQSLTPYPKLNSEIPKENYQAAISVISK
ncbi:MAG: hypothetical protein DWQ06_11875 [Calditrichaeota bacterium]|nr:MAG: hypothetical protein DWQ06_11875 [Calditrichota bacterium]